MKKGRLPRGWYRWRRYRYQGLTAQGMSGGIAWDIAKAETKWRHRLSRIISNREAREAELVCVSSNGQLRFLFTGNLDGLAEEQAAAIEELSRGTQLAA